MEPSKFRIANHSGADKQFMISNDRITMMVDYDQVSHKDVDKEARRIVQILNAKENQPPMKKKKTQIHEDLSD